MIGWRDLRREPFRVLFPLGAAFGCLGIGHWLVYALGWSQSYSGFFHASIQVEAYLYCFISGFLLTALPRFAGAPPAATAELAGLLLLLTAQTLFLCLGRWASAGLCHAGLLLLLAEFAGRRFLRRQAAAAPPPEFLWLPMAIGMGLVGGMLLMCGQAGWGPRWWIGVGRPMVQQGFALGAVLGVGGFLAPRLFGRPARAPAAPGVMPETVRRRLQWHGLAGLLFFATFWVEGAGAVGPAYLGRAAVATGELWWTTQLLRPPATQDIYVRFLWVSLWLVLAGLWGAGLVPAARVVMLHLVFLGGLSLMIFAIGTMVVLSHTGDAQALRGPLWIWRIVGWGVGAALAARVAAEWQPERYFLWLGLASSAWLVAGISWIVFALPRVCRAADPDAFEQAHEAAKRDLLRTREGPCQSEQG